MNKVEEFFQKSGWSFQIQYLPQSTATVQLAAQALCVPPERIAKTLALQLKNSFIVIVFAGTSRIDNQKYKKQFGVKPKMISHSDTLEHIGHPVGGVCPFALPDNIAVYLDESLLAFDYIYPAAGTDNSAVKMTPQELQQVTSATWVHVSQSNIT